MTPTIIGFVTFLLGAYVLIRWRSPLLILCLVLVAGMFQSSAVAILTAVGGSTITPPRFLLLFLFISVAAAVSTRASLLREAVTENAPLLIFCLYGVLSALLLPRIFAGQIYVFPLRPTGLRNLYDTFPLAPTSQNITTAIYLAGTGLTALCAYIAARLARDVTPLVKTGIFIGLTHSLIGILGVTLAGTQWDLVVEFVRNASYSQLSQEASGMVRMAGFAAEPSVYANFAGPWFIFLVELWLRDVSRRWTGFSALVVMVVLVLSTSSSAYVLLAGYGLILLLRMLAFPHYMTAGKLTTIALLGIGGLLVLLGIYLSSARFAQQFGDMFQQMTVGKSDSESGLQRMFWAMQGVDAFVVSNGLGIGAGSFRSSSLIMAILGSMGVIGLVTFGLYCLSLLRIFGRSANRVDHMRGSLSEACIWAALIGLLPALIIGPSPDPGMEFAIFAALGLALRYPRWQADHDDTLQLVDEYRPERRSLAPVTAQEVPQSGGWRRFSR
ncbi:MAG: glycoside hydrolase [Sphingomonadaceae bacterium]